MVVDSFQGGPFLENRVVPLVRVNAMPVEERENAPAVFGFLNANFLESGDERLRLTAVHPAETPGAGADKQDRPDVVRRAADRTAGKLVEVSQSVFGARGAVVEAAGHFAVQPKERPVDYLAVEPETHVEQPRIHDLVLNGVRP